MKMHAMPITARNAPIQAPGAGLSLVAIQRIGRMRTGEVADSVDTSPAGPWARAKRSKFRTPDLRDFTMTPVRKSAAYSCQEIEYR